MGTTSKEEDAARDFTYALSVEMPPTGPTIFSLSF
jgi:hypothetical protein